MATIDDEFIFKFYDLDLNKHFGPNSKSLTHSHKFRIENIDWMGIKKKIFEKKSESESSRDEEIRVKKDYIKDIPHKVKTDTEDMRQKKTKNCQIGQYQIAC